MNKQRGEVSLDLVLKGEKKKVVIKLNHRVLEKIQEDCDMGGLLDLQTKLEKFDMKAINKMLKICVAHELTEDEFYECEFNLMSACKALTDALLLAFGVDDKEKK